MEKYIGSHQFQIALGLQLAWPLTIASCWVTQVVSLHFDPSSQPASSLNQHFLRFFFFHPSFIPAFSTAGCWLAATSLAWLAPTTTKPTQQ